MHPKRIYNLSFGIDSQLVHAKNNTSSEEYNIRSYEEPNENLEEIIKETKLCELLYKEEEFVCKRCLMCPICVYLMLERYNLFSEAYENFELAHKYLFTLSSTQVACERSFSTLKFIKNRLGEYIVQFTFRIFPSDSCINRHSY